MEIVEQPEARCKDLVRFYQYMQAGKVVCSRENDGGGTYEDRRDSPHSRLPPAFITPSIPGLFVQLSQGCRSDDPKRFPDVKPSLDAIRRDRKGACGLTRRILLHPRVPREALSNQKRIPSRKVSEIDDKNNVEYHRTKDVTFVVALDLPMMYFSIGGLYCSMITVDNGFFGCAMSATIATAVSEKTKIDCIWFISQSFLKDNR